MPIYEYQCQSCHHCFEKLVFAADESAMETCPQCGENKVEKLMSCANTLGGEKRPFCAPGSSGIS